VWVVALVLKVSTISAAEGDVDRNLTSHDRPVPSDELSTGHSNWCILHGLLGLFFAAIALIG
jgi:hypothetical protein